MFETHISGLGDLRAALARIQAGIDAAAAANVKEMSLQVVKDAQANFSGAHRKGRPRVPNSQNYPNIVTGTLRRSIQSTSLRKVGPGVYSATVGPSTVYARAVELGNPRSHSGAYPYFGPAVKKMRGAASGIIAANVAKFIK